MAHGAVSFPAPTKLVHKNFCVTEGWSLRGTATGQTGTHHHNFELELPDKRVLYTRISHPLNRDSYGQSIWSHILRNQLEVSHEVFWGCVKEGKLPDRGTPEPAPVAQIPATAIPVWVFKGLLSKGYSESALKQLSGTEAEELLLGLWASGE